MIYKFKFEDVLALQYCMEAIKDVREDKVLYEQLNILHSKVYNAYVLEKRLKKSKNLGIMQIMDFLKFLIEYDTRNQK